jgi:PAS domain-containing protein
MFGRGQGVRRQPHAVLAQRALRVVDGGVDLRSSHDFSRNLTGTCNKGLARRALPIIILSALTLGRIRVLIQHRGLVDTAFGTALRTMVEVALVTGLLWWAMRMIRTHEQALRESEAEVRRQARQLATFVETAAIGMHRVGPDGTILWANDAELEMLGYRRGTERDSERGKQPERLRRPHGNPAA